MKQFPPSGSTHVSSQGTKSDA